MPPKAKGAGKKKNGYQMPEKFEDGFSLKDIFKTTWTLGKPIGQGGFGLIYLASKGEAKIKNPDHAEYVIKIEPKDNGPLFCETHFYVNCAKEDELKSFMKANALKHLAMPRYISSGICTYNSKEYRFLVMDRYVKDLQSVLNDSPTHNINEIGVLCLMRQIMYSLEYIHRKGYTHGDIKGANLMLKSDRESYLVDYGLACRFQRDNVHAKYEIKPERRHNGTIEYTSRDAHCGAQTYRRSDLEILGYCVIHWLSGTLPWLNLISNCEQVQQSKIKNMNNSKEFVKTTLTNCSEQVKSFIEYFLSEVNKLEFDSEPPYSKIHQKLTETLRLIGHSQSALDNFAIFKPPSVAKTPKSSDTAKILLKEDDHEKSGAKKNARSRKRISDDNQDEEDAKFLTVDDKNKPLLKAKSETPAKSATPTTKKATTVSKSKNRADNLIEELSDIEDDQSYHSKDKVRNAKKARNNLQSTALDQTDIEHFKTNLKQIIEDDKKVQTSNKKLNPVQIAQNELSTRNNNGVVSSPKVMNLKQNGQEKAAISPRGIARNKNQKINEEVIENEQEEEYHENKKSNQQSDQYYHTNNKQSDYLTKDLVNTPSKYNFRTPSKSIKSPQSQQKSAHKDTQLNKIRQQESVVPRSPLALSNLDKKSEVTLVKKRKNVAKSTVATQTENSYLLAHQPFFKN